MINDILAGLPWGLFLSFMVGPVFFILLETSITKGFRAAIVFDFGVVLGDIFFIAIAYLGSYRLIQSLKDKPALFIFGGIIMLAYGLISFVRLKNEEKIDDEEIDRDIIKRNYGSLFIKGFLLNVINIGVLGFWLAVIISVGPKLEMQNSRMITFFTSVIITYLLVDCIKILLAKQLKSKMTPTNILKIKKAISIVLMVFGWC
jgi:threonine/homoserine/homoserine lactone efflux protein